MKALTTKADNKPANFGFKAKDIELIKATVAKNATDEELKLFLYRAQILDLDPLKPGQIYFVKYGNSPGTIVIGLDGFRARAAKTKRLAGIKRGIIRDDKGKCIGAWAEVYRNDWTHPAREEVALAEYNTYKAMWAKMPETMIKKVAEVAALRMAFPDELGGMYSDDEMKQADHAKDVTPPLETEEKELDEYLEDESSYTLSKIETLLNEFQDEDLKAKVYSLIEKGKSLDDIYSKLLDKLEK